ncbi:DMT family transporter [Marimonas arenosa]|uniref:DMT family transporter n=1 Tax=Marimonas arenosa TaxID=1795305 RepID=A0AAE3WBP1_9RHOB|nr:DMT family transporter [Marimonas arenosa]MDQ2090256.1 DMT family transporter [Marimonas arenosa]
MAQTNEPATAALIWRVAPVVFVIFWAGGYSFAKLGLPHIEPITMLVVRFGLAAAILGGLLAVLRVDWPRGTAHWGALALSGFLIQSVYFGLGYQALKSGVNAGTMAILMALQPILVGVLSLWLTPGTSGGLKLWSGLFVGFGGVVLVIFSGDALGPSPGVGLGFAMASLVGITAATLFEKRHGFATHPLVGSLVQYVVGFVTLVPVAMVFETGQINWHPELVVALIYLVIGNSLISVTLFVGLVQRGDATRISALLYLVPPLAVLIAWIVLGETMGMLAFVGFLLSVAGVWLVNRATS